MITMNKNKLIALVVILVIVASYLIWLNLSSVPILPPNENTDVGILPESPAGVGDLGIEDTSTGSVNASSPAVTISYANALIKYKDARIQLNAACQTIPNNMTFKNGTNIMIDNRAPVALTVKVGSVFTIKAYGFKIVKLSSATLPATWLVDCGTSQNVATILIQK